LRHSVDLSGRTVVDQIEKRRKRAAQVDAASASMADVEYASQLLLQSVITPEVRGLPCQRMSGRRFEAALAHGHRDCPEVRFRTNCPAAQGCGSQRPA